MTARFARLATLLALLALAAPAAAPAATKRLYIRGAGFGHGVGMSQFGAYGFAKHGQDYKFILAHYYSGTELGKAPDGHDVRVLLQSTRGSASFTGATKAGDRALSPDRVYSVSRVGGGQVTLNSPTGRSLGTFSAPLRVAGDGPLTLRGAAGNGVRGGRYRGALEFRPGLFSGVNAINVVPLEDYVRGVVPAEEPASWPDQALRAQAVAARTYALTANAGGKGFDQYPDTRSQVYRGLAAEAPTSDAAIAATAGEIVTYGGRPVITYFFSTSGGQTENVEFAFIGTSPDPWLQSVSDPFDDASPRHRWGPFKLTIGQAQRKLRGVVRGRFRSIKVVERGKSPRVVYADVIGTGGRTRVTGPQLRTRLGLFDTWAYFTVISAGKKLPPDPDPAPPPTAPPPTTTAPPPTTTTPPGGGTPAPGTTTTSAAAVAAERAAAAVSMRHVLAGAVTPGVRGAVAKVQVLRGTRWATIGDVRLGAGGRYVAAVPAPGRYRIVYDGLTGPSARIP
jgi:stage II sporulation protein D